jgi:hypothetical protein
MRAYREITQAALPAPALAALRAELEAIADDLAASVANWKPGEYCVEIVNGANWAVRRIRAVAGQL